MPDIYSKCGMNCGHCPWSKYTRETMTNEEYESFRDQCLKVLGHRPHPIFPELLRLSNTRREDTQRITNPASQLSNTNMCDKNWSGKLRLLLKVPL